VLEAARNVATSGARPLALVNCLNFGNPEHPDVMWQFSEVVEGISEACEALDIPVIGGNVSFYNESRGADIHPTPVVAVVGLVDDLTATPPPPAFTAGDAIVVLGTTRPELGGSEWAAVVHGETGGRPPVADLDAARALHAFVAEIVREREVSGVHDVSDGGLAVALAEMAFAGGVGFKVDLATDGCTVAEACFSESTSRVVVSVPPDRVAGVLGRATAAEVPAKVAGDARGDRLVAADGFDVPLADAARTWRNALPALLSPVSPAG
jgi:phosphoribosylformylglycinamidine synthase